MPRPNTANAFDFKGCVTPAKRARGGVMLQRRATVQSADELADVARAMAKLPRSRDAAEGVRRNESCGIGGLCLETAEHRVYAGRLP